MTSRRFWRLHLSTLVVLTLVAGALLGANIYPQSHDPSAFSIDYGFPLPAFCEPGPAPFPGFRGAGGGTVLFWSSTLHIGPFVFDRQVYGWTYSLLAVNVACAIVALAFVAVLCEWAARRRESRK